MELLDHWLLSSDTHIVEPPDLFTSRMSKRFLPEAPHTELHDGYECWFLEGRPITRVGVRSEEHTSELQSLMRISYAVFCLKKKTISSVPLHSPNTITRKHK